MSFRKYLRLARTRRYKEILSGGFESNKTGMCDLACKIICPVLSLCYYFQMWNSHSSKILQVKLGQEKTMVSAIKGTPMGAARRRAAGASGQHCACCGDMGTWGHIPASALPPRQDLHVGWGTSLPALLSEQMHCFSQKRAQLLASVLGDVMLTDGPVPSPPRMHVPWGRGCATSTCLHCSVRVCVTLRTGIL